MELEADIHARLPRVDYLPSGLDVVVDRERRQELDRVDRGRDEDWRSAALQAVVVGLLELLLLRLRAAFFVSCSSFFSFSPFVIPAPAAARAAGGAVEVVERDGAGEGIQILEDAADADSLPAVFFFFFSIKLKEKAFAFFFLSGASPLSPPFRALPTLTDCDTAPAAAHLS